MGNPESEQWMIIVNPNAGRRRIAKDWDKIQRHCVKAGLQFQSEFTKHKDHATEITAMSITQGYRNFIAVGGDGTLNEVINGIFLQQVIPTNAFIVGMIPVGTGNDWCRMWNIPFKYKEAIMVIRKGRTFIQDIGRVEYFDGTQQKTRYFINVAGMGYDALVASKTNRDKSAGLASPLSYLKNLVTSLIFYKYSNVSVIINNENKPLCYDTFSLSIGICKYNGGGMMQLPNAIPDDGLLDMTLIKKLGRFSVIRNLNKLFDGTLITHPKVVTFTGHSIHIESNPAIQIETDGESIGFSPAEFSIINKGLKIITGDILQSG
jgi:YegS/Rv2252/BmrU family lipid kinase